ncbi:MAG: DUF2520 domain-containing protein [Burkholderiaceae bacterium]|nr:DUF2520 domain-containing protein [Burkholderiaceae bacterium]
MQSGLSLAFVGAGRLAQSLAPAWVQQGLRVVAVASRQMVSAQALAQRLPGCEALPAEQAVARADLVFITTPDDAIAATVAALPWRPGQAVVHCSGASELSVLRAAEQAGAGIGGFHPLQIFSDPELARARLSGAVAAIEASAPLRGTLWHLAQVLGMRPIELPPGSRARYHGAASFAASFMLSLLDEAVQVLYSLGLDSDQALQALLPLARGTLDSAESRGLAGALSGPISRGDVAVIARHLEAFQGLGAAHLGLYRDLALRQLDLARRSRRLSDDQLSALAQLLSAA